MKSAHLNSQFLMARKSILATKSLTMQQKVKDAPLLPGCYLYHDSEGTVIYVGKARVLRNRIKSYFNNYYRTDEKTRAMIDVATSIDYVTVDSELEALLLENNLIKKYLPKYNIMMRDDKSYIYVKFEHPNGGKNPSTKPDVQDFPRIELVREKMNDRAEYFGPFPDSMPARRLLKRLRKVFPYRTCNRRIIQLKDDPITIDTNNSTPCLYYHLGLCNAPCAGLQNKDEYQTNFSNIVKFFRGEKLQIVQSIEKEMLAAARSKDFETAAKLRNRLNDIKYIGTNIRLDRDIDEISIVQDKEARRKKALEELIKFLEFPTNKLQLHPGFKIECYDISNIQGTNAVGAMVVNVDGEMRPDLYRKFRIKMKNEPNDFAMLQEVLGRRIRNYLMHLKYEQEPESINQEEYTDNEGFTVKSAEKAFKPDPSFGTLPDLIIIDGGKGQLSSTYKILMDYNLHDTVPIVGLAKKEEEIFKVIGQFEPERQISLAELPEEAKLKYVPVDNQDFSRILLPRRSESLYLVQRTRDEAHRTGITYHRKLRSKQLTKLNS